MIFEYKLEEKVIKIESDSFQNAIILLKCNLMERKGLNFLQTNAVVDFITNNERSSELISSLITGMNRLKNVSFTEIIKENGN